MFTIEMMDGTKHEWTVDTKMGFDVHGDLSEVKRVSVSGDELPVVLKRYPSVVAETPEGESVVFVDNAARFILPTCGAF